MIIVVNDPFYAMIASKIHLYDEKGEEIKRALKYDTTKKIAIQHVATREERMESSGVVKCWVTGSDSDVEIPIHELDSKIDTGELICLTETRKDKNGQEVDELILARRVSVTKAVLDLRNTIYPLSQLRIPEDIEVVTK